MAKVVIGSIMLRSGFSSEWNRQAPDGDSIWQGYVLEPGEIGIEKPSTQNILEDPYLMKIGDGNSTWASLPYVGASATEGYVSTPAIAVDNNRNLINLICSSLDTNAAQVLQDGLYVRDRIVRVYKEGEEYVKGDFIVSEDMTEFGTASETFVSSTWKQDVTNNYIKKITPIFSQENIVMSTQTLEVYVKQDTGIDLEGTKGTQLEPFASIPYAIYSVRKRMLGKNIAIKIILLNNDNGDVTYSLTPDPSTSYLNESEYFSFRDVYLIEGEDKNSVFLNDVYLGEADLEVRNVTISSSSVSNLPAVASLRSSKITFRNCLIMADPNLDLSMSQTSLDINTSYVIFDTCKLENTLGVSMDSFVKAQSSVLVFHDTTLGGQKIAESGAIIDNIDTLVVLNSDWDKEYCGYNALNGDLANIVASNEATVIGIPYQYIRRYQIDQESNWDLDLLAEQFNVSYKTTEFTERDEVTPVAFRPKISSRVRNLNGETYRKYYYIGPPIDYTPGYTLGAISPKGQEYINAGDGEKDGIEWVAKTDYQKSRIYSEPNPDNGDVAHFVDKPSRDQFQDNDFYINQFVEDSDISSISRVSDTFNALGTPFSKSKNNNITQGFIIKFNALKKPKIRFKKDDNGEFIDRFAASALKFAGNGEDQYLGWHTRVESENIFLVFSIFTIRENKFIDIDTIYDSSRSDSWIKTEIKLHRPIEGSINDARILGEYDSLDDGVRFPLLWANIGYVIVTSGEKIPYISPAKISADYIVDKDNRYAIINNVIQDTEIEVETLRFDATMADKARYVLDESEELPEIGQSRVVNWNMFDINPVFDGLGYEKLPTIGEYSETYQINIEECNKVESREPCHIEDLPDVEYVKIVNVEDKIVGEAIVGKKQYGLPVFQITPTQFEGSFDAYDTLDGGDLD